MSRENFKNGKLTLTYDVADANDKVKKIRQDIKKGKVKLKDLTRAELEQLVTQ